MFFEALLSKLDCDISDRRGLHLYIHDLYLHELILGLSESISDNFIVLRFCQEKYYFLTWFMTTSVGVVYGK